MFNSSETAFFNLFADWFGELMRCFWDGGFGQKWSVFYPKQCVEQSVQLTLEQHRFELHTSYMYELHRSYMLPIHIFSINIVLVFLSYRSLSRWRSQYVESNELGFESWFYPNSFIFLPLGTEKWRRTVSKWAKLIFHGVHHFKIGTPNLQDHGL